MSPHLGLGRNSPFDGYTAREFLREKQLQLFGDMMGIRVALSQSAVSLQETKINQAYHQAKFSLTHDKLNLDEAMRYVERSEMLLPEITRDRKRLYELAGSVAVLFPGIPLDIFANVSKIGEKNGDILHFRPTRPRAVTHDYKKGRG